jgi:hypothetical protein
MYQVCAPNDELCEKIIYYEAKRHAIDDCMIALKSNDDITLSEKLKFIRRLSAKQFMTIVKKSKL